MFFSNVSEYIQLFESGDGAIEESVLEFEEASVEIDELPYKSFKVSLVFTDNLMSALAPSFKKLQLEHLNLMSFNLPMLVPPKSWKFTPISSERDGRKLISAVDNFSGGLLLNNILIKRPLCKAKSYFADHSLQLTSEVVDFVNRLQKDSVLRRFRTIELLCETQKKFA